LQNIKDKIVSITSNKSEIYPYNKRQKAEKPSEDKQLIEV
jgi:hypothetical protein